MEMEQDWTMAFIMASSHIPVLGRTTAGFLADWFVLFWDLYLAKVQSVVQPVAQPDAASPQRVDKRMLIQRFMTVIGLGKRDPASLNDEERRYLMAMVQRYSGQPVAPPSSPQQPSSRPNRPPQPQPNLQQQKKPRTETPPTGVSFSGPQHGPVGALAPPLPPLPLLQSLQSHQSLQPLQSLPSSTSHPKQQDVGIADPMDRMMASMLSSIIGSSLEPSSSAHQPDKHPINQELYFKPTSRTLEPRLSLSSSQPLDQPSYTLPSSPLLTRPASATARDDSGCDMMITPVSLSPPPQPLLDAEMESMLSSGSPTTPSGGSIELLDSRTVGSHGGRVSALVCLNDQHIASGGRDGQLKVFCRHSGRELASLALHHQAITAMAARDEVLLTFSIDRAVSVLKWSNQRLRHQHTLSGPHTAIQCAGLAAIDGRLVVVTCDSEGGLTIWERQEHHKFKPVWSMQLQRTGTSTFHHLATQHAWCAVSTSEEIVIVNLERLCIQRRIQCKFAVLSVSFSQGLLLATGCNVCCIFDPGADYALTYASPPFADKVYCCALLPNSHRLVVAIGSYQKLFLWDVASQKVSEFSVHSSIVSCLAVVQDSLITSGHDGAIKVHKFRVDSFEDDLAAVLKSLA